MVYLIIALILIALIGLPYLLKLKLVLSLEVSRENKRLCLLLQINKISILKFTLVFKRYGKGMYSLKYYKKDKLMDTYELKDLFERKEKKKGIVTLSDIIDVLDMFFDKRRIIIGKLSLNMDIGLEDAAATALLSGIVISIVNISLARLYSSQGIPKTAVINIKPYFGHIKFDFFLECILSIRLAYIIMAGIKIFLSFLRKKVSAIASHRKHPQDNHG